MSTLKKYENLASKDPLTGLYNHGRIETEIMNAVEGCKKDGYCASMMIMDIDFFKRVNDEYGHAVGDMTLSHFADTVSGYCQQYDCAVGRWGGEEFVVVCYKMDKNKLYEVANQLRVRVMNEIFNHIGHITCSIGVTGVEPKDMSDDVFERMDRALYQAKADGRNCVRME